jgi:hypothetical protein
LFSCVNVISIKTLYSRATDVPFRSHPGGIGKAQENVGVSEPCVRL